MGNCKVSLGKALYVHSPHWQTLMNLGQVWTIFHKIGCRFQYLINPATPFLPLHVILFWSTQPLFFFQCMIQYLFMYWCSVDVDHRLSTPNWDDQTLYTMSSKSVFSLVRKGKKSHLPSLFGPAWQQHQHEMFASPHNTTNIKSNTNHELTFSVWQCQVKIKWQLTNHQRWFSLEMDVNVYHKSVMWAQVTSSLHSGLGVFLCNAKPQALALF